MKSRLPVWQLCLIIAIALFLRLWGITEKGLALYDEGQAHLECRFLTSALVCIADESFSGNSYTGEELAARLYGTTLLHPKPLHALLGMPIALLTGGADYSLLLPMAVLSALTIIPVYRLAKRFGGVTAGLVAGAIWAISPVGLLYGREALAEADAVFFVTWALWAVVRMRHGEIPAWRGGLLAGAALACNYRLAIALVPLLVMLFWGQSWKKSWKQALFWCLSAAIIPLVLLLGFEGINSWLQARGVNPGGVGYLGSLGFFGSEHGTQGFNLYGLFTFPYILFILEGIPLLILYISGIWWACRNGGEARLVMLSGLFPAILFTFHAFHMMRAFYAAFPVLAVFAGVVSVRVWEPLQKKVWRFLPHAIAAILLIGTAPYMISSMSVRSGIPEAQKWLNEQGKGQFHTQMLVAAAYSNPSMVFPPPASDEELSTGPSIGIYYLVTDVQRGLWGYGQDSMRNQVVASYEHSHRPVRVMDNPAGRHPQFLLEHNLGLGVTMKALDEPANGEIRIYRLEKFELETK